MGESNYPQEGHVMSIRYAKVLSTKDVEGGDRLMVYVTPENSMLSTGMWAFPLLPKILYVKPKVGEWVLILSSSNMNYYIGPVIAQKTDMNFCGDGIYDKFIPGGEAVPEATDDKWDGFAKDSEVGIEGRKNSSIIVRDNDVLLSSGLRKATPNKDSDGVSFSVNNDGDESFIDLKYDEEKNIDEGDINNFRSTATVHADKIFLVGKTSNYDKWNPSVKFINNKTGDILGREKIGNGMCDNMDELNNATSPLAYGDKLVEFLELFRDAFKEHVHWLKTPILADESSSVMKLLNYNLDKLLSNNVKIN